MAQQNNQQGGTQSVQLNYEDVEMGEDSGGLDEGAKIMEEFLQQGPPPDEQLQEYNTLMYGNPEGLSDPNLYVQTNQYDQSGQYVPPGQYPQTGQLPENQFQLADPGGPQFSAPPPVQQPRPPSASSGPLPPVIGFLKGGREYTKSKTGPLARDIPREFPRPSRHQVLEADDQDKRERRLLYYVDDSGQREGESFYDYSLRMNRANENMGLEIRQRPELPPRAGFVVRGPEYNAESRRRRIHQEKGEKDHLNKMVSDQHYAQKWREDKAKRQVRNTERRRRALQRLRNEYEHIGIRGFPSPPPIDDSGDELYTFDESGPLNGRGGRRRGPPRINRDSQNAATPSTTVSNDTPGDTLSLAADQSSTDRRCARCARKQQECSMQYNSTFPCEQCKEAKEDGETEEECLPQITGRRGEKPRKKRGPKPQNNRLPAGRRSRSASPGRGACRNCRVNGRTCDGKRPCDQCAWELEDCDGAIQGQTYGPTPQGSMTDPAAGFQSPFNPPPQAYSNTQGFRPPPQPSQWGLSASPLQRDFTRLQPFDDVRATFHGNNMQYPIPAATLAEAASLTWPGGPRPVAPGSNQWNHENAVRLPFRPASFSPYTMQNNGNGGGASSIMQDSNLDPSLFTSNQQLPPSLGQGRMAAPPADPTGSAVLPYIKAIRLALPGFDTSKMNANLSCDEIIDSQTSDFGFDVCGETPTMPCDHLQHGNYNVCDRCHYATDTDIMGKVNQTVAFTKIHMCRTCADAKKEALTQGDDNVRVRCCLCVGQMQQAWLCDHHKREAFAEVRRKSMVNLEYTQRKAWGPGQRLCLVCNQRPADVRSRGWVCIACGEHVVER